MLILRRIMCYGFGLILLPVTVLIVTGCGSGSYGDEMRDEARSLLRDAREHRQGGNFDKALGAYLKAIKADPDCARAHFDCAVLLQDDFSDYVGAIYHYRRYLDLKPDTEKREMIKERIRVAFQSLVGRRSRQGEGIEERGRELLREYAQLREENARLKKEVAVLEAKLERSAAGGRGTPVTGGVADGSVSSVGGGDVSGDRLYRVKGGDNLTRIAIKMYGSSEGSERIFEANRDRLDDPDDLRAGQILVIPR